MDDQTKFVAGLPPAQWALAKALHQTLLNIQPAYEVRKAWGGLGYKLGKNYSCLIAGYKDHLKLMIWRGVDLEDPKGVLEGKGRNTRHIKYYPNKKIDVVYLRKLLHQQFKLYN